MARCLWCTEELEESSMVFCSRSCEEALCHAMVIYVASRSSSFGLPERKRLPANSGARSWAILEAKKGTWA